MISVQIESPLGWLALCLGAVLLASMLVAGWQLWWQQRQLRATVNRLAGQLDVFVDASISVAQTVEQAVVMAPGEASQGASKVSGGSRREVLQVAQRRLAQGQAPALVKQTLDLRDDELRLLCLGGGSAEASAKHAAAVNKATTGHQAVA